MSVQVVGQVFKSSFNLGVIMISIIIIFRNLILAFWVSLAVPILVAIGSSISSLLVTVSSFHVCIFLYGMSFCALLYLVIEGIRDLRERHPAEPAYLRIQFYLALVLAFSFDYFFGRAIPAFMLSF